MQEWWYEPHNRISSPIAMLSISHEDMASADVLVDALDLYAFLYKPAEGAQTDLSMPVYVLALRQL